MKNLLILIILTISLFSCTPNKPIFNGKKYVTEKQYFRENKRLVKKILKDMSKEERDIITNSDIKFNYKNETK